MINFRVCKNPGPHAINKSYNKYMKKFIEFQSFKMLGWKENVVGVKFKRNIFNLFILKILILQRVYLHAK